MHSIDGPALIGLTREQLLLWKVKPIDATTILQGVAMLKRISDGDIGWAPGADANAVALFEQPAAPRGPKPTAAGRPTPRGKKSHHATAAPAASDSADTSPEPLGGEGGEGGEGASPSSGAPAEAGEWALTSVGPSTARKGGLSARDDAQQRVAANAASPSYLRKVMTELHTSERVPLWKEEMVERVKRAATARQQQLDLEHLSASAPPTARLAHSSTRRSVGESESVVDSIRGGGAHGSVADSQAEMGMTRGGSTQAREIERKLFWYQDAIHEQELQQQLLEQKSRALGEEVADALNKQRHHPELKGVGVVHLEKEMHKRQLREKARLSRALQVSEERVADAERLNKSTVASINKLRRGRADFLHQVNRLEERVNVMMTDMKHFAAAAHASLDEKEKVEARLKRQQFDYRNELSHTENIFDMLQSELQVLEEKISAGHQAEEEFMQHQRQEQFRSVKLQRDDDQKRELKLGYLQNHVRGQEMDFQRLHRIMGVKFTPEKPDSVQEIVKASLSHEQRNASLLHYVGVQNVQIEEIEEQVRLLEKEESSLKVETKKSEEESVVSVAEAERAGVSRQSTLEGISKRDEDLKKLCPIVETLCSMSGASSAVSSENAGILQLKGCRPDTLTDYLRLIDVAIKELRSRAESLPTASGNEWLRDFLAYHEVVSHPTVTEIRKELETAAQKVKEQKEAKIVMGEGGGESAAAPLSLAAVADASAALPMQE